MNSWLAALAGWASGLLGLHTPPADLTLLNMCSRALVVMAWGIAIVRWGDRRLLGRNAGFDMLLVVVLGSVLSRAVNGQSAFFPTLGVSAFLILLHHGLSLATTRSHRLSRWIKGSPRGLVRNGKIDELALKQSKLSHDDLDENLRLNGNISDIHEVEEARLERNGAISIVKK